MDSSGSHCGAEWKAVRRHLRSGTGSCPIGSNTPNGKRGPRSPPCLKVRGSYIMMFAANMLPSGGSAISIRRRNCLRARAYHLFGLSSYQLVYFS